MVVLAVGVVVIGVVVKVVVDEVVVCMLVFKKERARKPVTIERLATLAWWCRGAENLRGRALGEANTKPQSNRTRKTELRRNEQDMMRTSVME
jgi:hypothetical protein